MFETLDAGLAEVAAADVSVAPGSLGEEIPELMHRRNGLDAQISRRLVAYERSGAWAVEQLSCGGWLRTQTTLSHGQSAAQQRVARTQDRLPQLAACWQAGKISFAHWQAVADGLRLLPQELWAEVDGPLAVVAPAMTSQELGDHLRRLAEALIPTPKPKDETRREARRLSSKTGFNGMMHLIGHFTPEVGEKFRAAMSAASRPDAPGELRLPNQRNADAFEEILDRVLGAGSLPTDGGQRPHINVLVPLELLGSAAQLAEHDPALPYTPMGRLTADERAELITEVTTRLDAERAGTVTGGPRFSWTGPTSIATARRLVCDGAITPIFTRGGVPLDVGRTSRTLPAGLRTLIVTRDQQCIWDGCTMPARWCEIHHLWPWADGGPTNADTLGLLCDAHHAAAHSGRYTVIVTAPGVIRTEPRTRPDQPLYRFEFPVSTKGDVCPDEPDDPDPPHRRDTSPDPHEQRGGRSRARPRPGATGPGRRRWTRSPDQGTLHDAS